MNSDTFCVKHLDRKKFAFQYKHYNMVRVAVKGQMTAANILKACKARSLKPICDHKKYADGKCLNLRNNWHWSHAWHHVRTRAKGVDYKKLEWAFFYANSNRALMSNGHSHRWTKKNHHGYDRDGDTFCGKIDSKRFEAYKKKFFTFKVNGHVLELINPGKPDLT